MKKPFYAIFWLIPVFFALLVSCSFTSKAKMPLDATTKGVLDTHCATPEATRQEQGIDFPQWGENAYGSADPQWRQQLPLMQQQTGACWVGMPILFHQQYLMSTTITGPDSVSLAALTQGITYAHALGLHVFVLALLDVSQGNQSWSGSISFSTRAQELAWFANYWQSIQPLTTMLASTHTEQFSFAVEDDWLQRHASSVLWDQLLAQVHAVYPGYLTYDVNWDTLSDPVPSWLHNPYLSVIGVSAYFPRIMAPDTLNQQQIAQLWQHTTLPSLNDFARRVGKPLFFSEIGYRATSDAFYQPYSQVSPTHAPTNPHEQDLAIQIALQQVRSNPSIIEGCFFWAWQNAQQMDLIGKPATTRIKTVYSR